MAPALCAVCKTARALIKRPKNHAKLCKACFITIFEDEVHHTIISSKLFFPWGESGHRGVGRQGFNSFGFCA